MAGPDSGTARRRSLALLLPLGVLILTAAVYAATIGFEFIYDDHAQIVETHQLDSWRTLSTFFKSHVWSWKTPGQAGTYYRPLFMVWLYLVHSLFGVAPAGWHAASVAVHLLATWLVYRLAFRLTQDGVLGAIAALLFGLHPAHLESVAWVSGIPDPLVAVLLLTSMLFYLRDDRRSRALSVLAFSAALLTKEPAVILPAVLFGYEWLYLRGHARRLARSVAAVVPYIAVVLVYFAIRLAVLHSLTAIINPISRRQMIFTWPAIAVFYLSHLAWPFGLSIFYYLPVVGQVDFSRVILPSLALLVLGVMLFAAIRRSAFVGYCTLWMALPLAPALNIRVFQQNETVHDRYLYLSSIGFCMLAAFAIRHIRVTWLQGAVVALIAGMFAYGTATQSQYWANDFALFERGIAIAPENEIAQQSMGTVLLRENRPTDALAYFQRALERNPSMWEAAYPLARCYYELGLYAQSEPYFRRAGVLKPLEPKPYLYFGLAELHQGRLDVAEAAIRKALELRGPDDTQAYHAALGQVFEKRGNLPGALAEYRAELRENPASTEATEGIVRVGTGK